MSDDRTPTLQPLQESHEADEVEAQLKALTLDLFREYFRVHERELNVYGAPHLGSYELVERWLKADGLSVVRGNSREAVRYLFKAWRARNPRRGLAFLKTYLQLLWPGSWTVEQMWQPKDRPYPMGLEERQYISGDPHATHYLTSRVIADVEDLDEDGYGLEQIKPGLRSTLGAKFLLVVRLARRWHSGLGIINFTYYEMVLSTSGTLLAPPETTP